MKKTRMPEISIVVPALNEERYIMSVIKGIRSQTFKDFEVIFVDGKSTDRTVQIARPHGNVIVQRKKNIGAARNAGARAARGRIILFTNADTMASRGLLASYRRLFTDRRVVAATGPLVPLEKASGFMRFCYWFASVVLAKASFVTGKPAISGSNFAVRRSAFINCGGFDESLATYEDLDLAHRLSSMGRVLYANDAVVATSTRRIARWGVARYVIFNAANVARYNLFHRSMEHYEPVR
jgi:glycosyltransferase involved in cell wall biosynthesis